MAHPSSRRLLAAAATVLAGAGLMMATSAPAGAVTDPDRGICQDGTNSNPPGMWLRNPDNIGDNLLFLTKTGYAGSQDHFYITGEFTKSNGAHWWVGYGYDVDNNIKRYGAAFDQWVARSGGGCP